MSEIEWDNRGLWRVGTAGWAGIHGHFILPYLGLIP